eukprot:jgi/Chrpa1/17180/Chrysochromulina_OHIO_Genome00000991-RA
MRELEMSSVREVEDLLIECIYGGLLQGRLDQAAGQLDVFSCSARDVNPKELASMSESLLQVRPGSGCPVCAPGPTHRCVAPAPHSQWHSGAVQLMASVSEELGRFKQHQEDARTWQEDLDAKVSAVKVTLRSSQDAGDGTFGASELSSMEYDDDKMRKSGRFKARGKQSAR